jgi:hypothetical protein
MSGACSTHDGDSKYVQILNLNLVVWIQLERRESKLEDNINIDHGITECQSVDRNESVEDRVK